MDWKKDAEMAVERETLKAGMMASLLDKFLVAMLAAWKA